MNTNLREFFTRNHYQNSLMLFSLWAHIQAAICSTGYYHPDEHFQLLEPLGWKLGLYGPQDLAWEFPAQIRSGLQILLGWGIGKLLLFGNAYSPFMLTAILRQLSGLLSCTLCWAFYKKWKTELSAGYQQKALIVFTALLWFLPYLHVRYSSENWGALFFFGGLYFVQYPPARLGKLLPFITGGLLMGLSFYFRFQMGFAIAGYLAWAFWYKKFTLKTIVLFTIGGLIGAITGTLADYWLYGDWVFTPYNYFFQNIIQNKAAGFGTSPFYSYITMFIEGAAPPISILLLILIATGLWAGRKTPVVWVFLSFVVLHSLIAHKELRFMFPMVTLLPILCATGLGKITTLFKRINPLVLKLSYKLVLGINVALLFISVIKPGGGREALFKAFYIIHHREAGIKIAYAEKDPFDNGLKINFFNYCPKCFRMQDEKDSIAHSYYLFTSEIKGLPPGSEAKLQYCTAPIVPESFNFGHWQERTNSCFLWKIERND